MAKLWQGRTGGETDRVADDFNTSLPFDRRFYRVDILGSVAHARMLCKQGILSEADRDVIIEGLDGILADLEEGRLDFSAGGEDIHMFVEAELTRRIGEPGKRVHTARSRNDQVALDMRLYLREEIEEIKTQVKGLILALTDKAESCYDTIMPGYTHLQRAQPITFGHHLMAYGWMLLRDMGRLGDTAGRMNFSPIGSCALAGTTYPTDREYEADLLGFAAPMENSLDGVADRDYALELLSALSILMMHLSRLSEEVILWSSWEFRFVELDDRYTTGSSIMPQKKNPDMTELIRGKTGRVYGDLMSLLTTLKGLPLAYNKDMQEDKEVVFDGVDTVKACLSVLTPLIATMKARPDRMKKAAQEGFINATDLADYLTGKGLPFRTAYKISGELVTYCADNGMVLETLPPEIYREKCDLIEKDVYEAIALETCVKKRTSLGGTAPSEVLRQIASMRKKLEEK